MLEVPPAVREKALASGAGAWLAALPALVGDLEARWSLTTGHRYQDGTEALVARTTCGDGTEAVLKLALPGAAEHEAA